MKIFNALVLSFFISTFSFSQTSEKKILFRGDSICYAAENDFLFSSIDNGKNWDTIFGKRNPEERFFLNGTLDTATNIFISDAKTIFVFGWDGTMHYKTILYSTSNCGKSWSRNDFNSNDGNVGVKYFHKISSTQFFLDCRFGNYAITTDSGKNWHSDEVTFIKYCTEDEHGDERFTFVVKGDISYTYFDCNMKVVKVSHDGGLTFTDLPKK